MKRTLLSAAIALVVATDLAWGQTSNVTSDTQGLITQVLDWACNNRAWLLPIILGASWLSAITDKMPPWVAHIVHFVSGNWGDIIRALATHNPPPSATGHQ
jgi:hypothetical protein